MVQPDDILPVLPEIVSEPKEPESVTLPPLPDIEPKQSAPKEQTDFEKWKASKGAAPKEQTDFEKWKEAKQSVPKEPTSFEKREENHPTIQNKESIELPELPKIGGPLPAITKLDEARADRRNQYQEEQKTKREVYQERKSLNLPGRGPDPTTTRLPELPPVAPIAGGMQGNVGGMEKTNALLEKIVDLLSQIKDTKGGFR